MVHHPMAYALYDIVRTVLVIVVVVVWMCKADRYCGAVQFGVHSWCIVVHLGRIKPHVHIVRDWASFLYYSCIRLSLVAGILYELIKSKFQEFKVRHLCISELINIFDICFDYKLWSIFMTSIAVINNVLWKLMFHDSFVI